MFANKKKKERMTSVNDPQNYGDLLHLVDEELRRLYRRYESISKKLIKCKWSKTFNGICLKENILPTYTNIYIYIYIGGDKPVF